MSESAPEGGQQENPASGEDDGGGQPSFTQADLERKIAERLAQERKKYSDYGDLKKKASEFDKLAEQQKTDLQKAVEAARAEGRTEVQQKVNDRLLKAEVRALATGKLADPADALRLLDLSQFEVSDDGETDGKAIEAAIGDLIKNKPYLAARPSGFQGSDSDGPAGKPGGPEQVTEAEFSRMSPEQRVTARREGRLAEVLGGS